MTGPAVLPDFSDLKYPTDSSTDTTAPATAGPTQQKIPDFSDLKYDESPVVSYLKPRLKGMWGIASGIFASDIDTFNRREEIGRDPMAEISRRIDAFKSTIGAVTHTFGGFKDEFVKHPLDASEHGVESLVTGLLFSVPDDIVKFVTGSNPHFTDMVTKGHPFDTGLNSPMEFFTGGTKHAPVAITKATTEEIEQSSRNVTALAASYFLGAGASTVLEEAFAGYRPYISGAGIKALKVATTDAERVGILTGEVVDTKLLDLARKSGTLNGMPWAQRTITGLGGGVAGGFAYGYGAAPENSDKVAAGITMALIAWPLGLVHSAIGESMRVAKGSPVDLPEHLRTLAFEMHSAREFNGLEKPVFEILHNADNLQQVKPLQAAIARKGVEYEDMDYNPQTGKITPSGGKNAMVVPGVDGPTLPDVLSQLEPKQDHSDVISVIHPRADGLHDILVAPTDMPAHVQDFFQKTGYLQGQPVVYGGQSGWHITETVKKGSNYELTLRNAVTEQHVEGVKIGEVVRPTNDYIGKLTLYQTRTIKPSEIFDPAQGIATHANSFGPEDVSDTQLRYNQSEVSSEMSGSTGYSFDNPDKPTKFVAAGNREGQPAEIPIKRGEVNVLHDGNSHSAVYIDKEGQPAAVMSYASTPRASGGSPINRSSGQWHFQQSPYKTEATIAMAKFRAKEKIFVSSSDLSVGGQKATLRRLNENWRGRQYTVFGEYSKEAFLQDYTTGFLDHIAFFDGNIHLSPEEVMSRIGEPRSSGAAAVAGDGETLNTIARAREGMKDYGWDATKARGVTYRTKGTQVVSEKLASDRLASEVEAGHVPEVTTKPSSADPLTRPLAEGLSFDDLVASYHAGMPINAGLKSALKLHLEWELGRVLRNESTLIDKYTDPKTVSVWKARVLDFDKADKLIEDIGRGPNITPEQRLDQIHEAAKVLRLENPESATLAEVLQAASDGKKTRAVFEARIEQLEHPLKLGESLTDGETARMTELQTKAVAERTQANKELLSVAHANGMYVERGYGGAIQIRDMETHSKMPVSFISADEATQWIKDTGGVVGPELDGGSVGNLIPPESVGGGVMPNPGQGPKAHEIPYDFKPDTWFGRLGAYVDAQWPRLTGKRAYFSALDGKLKTKFYDEVYAPLQKFKMESQAMKQPHRVELKNIETTLNKAGIPRERWGLLDDYRSTMSVEDIDRHLFGDRPPIGPEIEMSHRLADKNIDIKTVYKYNRDVASLNEDARVETARLDPQAPDTPQKTQEIQQRTAATIEGVKKDLNMDAAHLDAAQMFDYAQKQGRDVFRLDVATRRAHALMNKEPSRSAFAEKNKMSATEIKAAEALDGLDKNLQTEAGLTENLMDYIQHHQNEEEPVKMNVSLNSNKLANAREKDTASLASKLVGTGEVSQTSRDPILNAANRINKIIDFKYFDTAWNDARSAAITHLKAMPSGAREYASRVISEYLYGMKGVPNAHDQYAKEMVKAHFDELGMTTPGKEPTKAEEQIITDFSDVLLSSSSAALLGGRPAQGARDLQGFLRNYYSRVGALRTANAFRLAFERNPVTNKLPIYELAETGKVPGLSVLQFLSEQEVSEAMIGAGGNHQVRDAVMKAAKVGLITSGQHNVYALAHAMAYMETRQFSGKVLLDLSRDNISKIEAYKKLKIDTYDIPVGEGFDNLVTKGKFSEASEYLAQATGAETAFIYGLQNHPYGWGSKQGRIMGQFGQWSIWDRDFLVRIASRGSVAQRAAAMSRYAMSEAALWSFGRATGFNVKSWYGVPGILFAGSPLMGLVGQITDMLGLRGKQRQRESTTVYGGKVPVLSQFLPGASAFADYYQAYQLAQQRYGPVPIIGKALGMSVDRTQRSWLDDLTEQFPRQIAGR